MLVGEAMTEGAITARPDASVREVAELMRAHNVGCVVLVGDGGAPSGFITDRDIALSVVAQGRSFEDRAAEHASSPVMRAEPDMEVEEATQRMVRHGVRRLVVVAGGAVTGVVTLDDFSARGLEPELSARVTRAALPEFSAQSRG